MKSQGFVFANEKVEIVSLFVLLCKVFLLGGSLEGGGLNVSFCGFESQIGQRCLILRLYV